MKAKALLVLSAIAMLGLASCSNGPETPVDSSEETSTSVEEPSSSSPEITETSSEDPVPEPVFYAVTDSIDDHVTIVGLPETAQEGDVITFRLAVDPGYEFLDVVLVKQGDNVVDLHALSQRRHALGIAPAAVDEADFLYGIALGLDFDGSGTGSVRFVRIHLEKPPFLSDLYYT